jgi:hypothetical protein
LAGPSSAESEGLSGERPSIRTVSCPLLRLEEVLATPYRGENDTAAAQRSISRGAAFEAVASEARSQASSGKAVLLNAIAPGAGHIYSGYDRGYLYLGIEAAAWFSFLVLREDGNRKEDQSEQFAGDPFVEGSQWSFARYESEGYCGAPGGSSADSTLRHSWFHDRQTFYDLIDGDASYRCGWDGESWRDYRDMRDKSDELLRWARYAGAAVILNHVVSVLDVFRLSRDVSVDVPGGANLKFTFKPDLPYPTGRVQIKKVF